MRTHLLIAQVEAPPPPDFSVWLSNAAWLVGLLCGVLWLWTLVRDLRSKKEDAAVPQPLVVASHITYTPQAQHDDLEADFRAFVERTDQRFAAMSAASSESREKIYGLIRAEMAAMNGRITELLGAFREMKGEIKHLSK